MSAKVKGMKAGESVKAEMLKIGRDFIEVKYRNQTYTLKFDRFPWFNYCTVQELFNVYGSACGLHWPDADIDLEVEYIDNPPERMSNMSLENWLNWRRNHRQVEAGRKGGRSTSPAKRIAAVANGRKGGRPRKELQHA